MTLSTPQRKALFALADGKWRDCWRKGTTVITRDDSVRVIVHRGVAHSLKRRGYAEMTFSHDSARVRISEAGLRLVHGSHQREGEGDRIDGSVGGDQPA
jgi:hypothetical protein